MKVFSSHRTKSTSAITCPTFKWSELVFFKSTFLEIWVFWNINRCMAVKGDKKQALHNCKNWQEQLERRAVEWSVRLLLHSIKFLQSSGTCLQPISCSTGDCYLPPTSVNFSRRKYQDFTWSMSLENYFQYWPFAYYPVAVGRKFLAVYPSSYPLCQFIHRETA